MTLLVAQVLAAFALAAIVGAIVWNHQRREARLAEACAAMRSMTKELHAPLPPRQQPAATYRDDAGPMPCPTCGHREAAPIEQGELREILKRAIRELPCNASVVDVAFFVAAEADVMTCEPAKVSCACVSLPCDCMHSADSARGGSVQQVP